MTSSPSLQTVLTVLSGAAPVRARSFPWGTNAEPFAVGARGAWVVEAAGVEPVHFYLGFDGRQVHVAAASPSVKLWLAANPVGPTWVPVPVGTELRFGEARIGVTCEELPARAAPTYEPRPSPIPASPMRTPSRRTHVIADHRMPSPDAVGTLRQEPFEAPPAPQPAKAPVLGFVTVQPNVRRHDDPGGSPQQQPGSPAQPPTQAPPNLHAQAVPPAAMHTVAIEAPRMQPAPAPSFPGVVQNPGLTIPVGAGFHAPPLPTGSAAPYAAPGFAPQHPAPGFGLQGAVAPLGHAGVARLPNTAPIGQPSFGSGANPAQASAQTSGAMTTAPSTRRPLETAQPAPNETGITVSDDGALRDLAAQVAIGIGAVNEGAAQDAYFANVKKKVDATPPPNAAVAPGQQGLGNAYPPAVQPHFHGQNPTRPAAGSVGGPQPPMAAAGGGWGPPGYATPPPTAAPEQPKTTPPLAQPTDAGIKAPSRLATAWRETSWVKKITLVLLPFAGYFGLIWEPPADAPPSTTTAVSKYPQTKPTSSAPTATTSSAPTATTTSGPRATTSAGLPIASGSSAVEPAASAGKAPRTPGVESAPSVGAPRASASAAPTAGPMPRDAFNAAIEGRFSEAARRYEQLSKLSDQRVYSLAARFAREQAVRKP